MIPEYESIIHVRISIKQREQIEALINIGKFKNLSQVVREALKQFLEKQLGEVEVWLLLIFKAYSPITLKPKNI